MTEDQKTQVWGILVEECGAMDSAREQFWTHWPDCVEFRFMGALGMGGKVWSTGGRVYVSCYREDETPDRLDMIRVANERLAQVA